ncbi:MAG: hypothetical protein J5552_02300 [Prevotella sp.]|nr:hypothetical protein [Prevotella sp.]
MKKTYKQPNTIIVKVRMQSMIANTTLGLAGTTNQVDDLLSRDHNSSWDDEDDDY